MVENTPAHQALLAHAAGPANNTSSVDGSFAEPIRDANGKIISKSHSSKDGTPHGIRHPSMTEPSPHLGFAARASRTAGVSATPDSQRKISGGHRSVSGPSPVVSHRSMGSPHSTKMPFYKTGLSIHKGDFDGSLNEEQISHKHGSKRSGRAAEAIPMDSYVHRNREGKPKRGEAGDDLYTPVGKRPPVEGRDSLTGGEKLDDAYKDLSDVTSKDIQQAAKFIPPTKLPIAEVRDLRSTRPQNLPCHDGDQQYNHQATSPLSRASTDLSLSLGKLRLTPGDERSPSDFITNDDFEYDDYVPQLPGSYFTMDPQAYTLTWSQQQPWGADKLKPVPSQDHDHAFY